MIKYIPGIATILSGIEGLSKASSHVAQENYTPFHSFKSFIRENTAAATNPRNPSLLSGESILASSYKQN